MALPFVLEADEVAAMVEKSEGLTAPDLLAVLVHKAKTMARPPISNYHVAAAGLGSTGRIYLGVNLEFSGLPLSQSVHSEQFLVTNAALRGETSITHIAVTSSVCGHCRQFLQEIRSAPNIRILVTTTDSYAGGSEDRDSFLSTAEFLPYRFSPANLLDPSVPLLLEPRNNQLIIENEVVVGGDSELVESALAAAKQSHAPYSGCPSGVALRGSNGRVFAGWYIESAAFNPSLPPIQAALVAFVVGGGGGYDGIERAVLVERKEAAVVQEGIVRLVLASVAPGCSFNTVHCRQHPINLDQPALNYN